ncbi:hypothetical protein BJF83_17515 [Nocardiopsis sp. CNR-923]|uniref:hypothetical protein n=1 Tax=Nocardiopsis sp. CNR-923 TaxID=1904965 RepID=UPI000965CB78|nr:hypothetical protein [Nocardiopsis sp. CNR-923]OLT27782.1 hypothetical protein BJF83_17515 [Nocardiopsis sp. CNR-923]
MPSPNETHTSDRVRLGRLIEERKRKLQRSWTAISQAGPIPPETLRRARIGTSPLADDTIERLDTALDWLPGSTQDVLNGGDPTPLEDVDRRYPVERQILDTPIGQVVREIYSDLEADDSLTPEQREEIRERTATRMREEVTMMVRAKRWENEERKRRESDSGARK